MRVLVLGPIEVTTGAGLAVPLPGAKIRGLIALLALDTGSIIPPTRLIDALWDEQTANGSNVLQVTVSKVRKILADAGEADRIITQPSGYVLEVPRDHVDAFVFEASIERARSLSGDPEALVEALTEALTLWRGAVLADVPSTAVTDALRARFDELRQLAIDDRVDAELALGRHRRLAPELESLVAAEPLRERRWGQLMQALYRSGQQADALRAYQRAREVLVEEMGVEPGLELRRLEAAVLAQDESVLGRSEPTPTAGSVGGGFRRQGNVRHPVGSCVGREQDLDRLRTMIERHRLVTLTGTGGVGKTRLALELAVDLLPDVDDGVWWIDLAAARDGADVMAELQRALQLDVSAPGDLSDAVADLAAVLGDGGAVLVLDNCEQLLGAIQPLVEDLLGRCGRVRVITTSRAPLDVHGEVLFTVHPLDLAAAKTLFVERIEGLGADQADAADAIERICERVDRLPLALELAAARARHLSFADILERLTDRFELLRGSSRTSRSAQNELRAVADWSYDLLEEPERLVFERLSVFAAGATTAAAREVCAGDGVEADEVEHLLERLVDQSLVHVDASSGQTRFRMLQTLYDYAGDRLASRGAENATRQAHAEWVRGLARAVAFGARTTGATISAVQDEDVAVRDAIGWAIGAEPALALDICTMLGPFWFGTMRVSTGWDLLETALDAAGAEDPELRSAALMWAVVFATMVQDDETSERLAEEAWAFETALGDDERLGRIGFARALAASYRSDRGSHDWVEVARRHLSAAGSDVGLGHLSFAEGAALLVSNDLAGAEVGLSTAADVFRREQDHLGLILAVSRLGELAWRLQDIDRFADLHLELLELGRGSRSPGVITGATARLALARLEQDELEVAQELAAAALESAGESFMPVINGYTFKTAGLVNLRLGHVAEGRDQLHTAIDAFERGTGVVGTGLAAMCWVDLSRSFAEAEDDDEAVAAAETAVELGQVAGDPWVVQQAEAQLTAVA